MPLWGARGWQRMANALEFPADIIHDWPRITMLGNRQVLIENHRGLVEYSASLVRVSLAEGEVWLEGRELTLGSLQPEQLLIEGWVEAVRYEL